MPDEAATAFVPGHATLFFAPYRAEDPEEAGSTGAGITLSHGVTVRVEPADETSVALGGEPAAVEAVERVLREVPEPLRVEAETPLPPGAGFGVSGAMALGTALAANAALGLARSENELIALAHRADVEAGTGLGDVVAQARGGVPIRLRPGAPGHGTLDGIPATARVEYLSFGDLDTPAVLAGDVGPIQSAGETALEVLRQRPTLRALFDTGRRFARGAGLLTPRVEEAIGAVLSSRGQASMAMLGETVVALDTGLTDAGYDPAACRIHTPGARIER